MSYLVTPSDKYIERIENSKHMLNCPKHMLNHDLDCLYRQSIKNGIDASIKLVENYLKLYLIDEPITTARNFVVWRDGIKLHEFNAVNVNSYVDKLPLHIIKKDRMICKWIEEHTEYYPNGRVRYRRSYPYKYK